MKRVGKPWFFVTVLLIFALAYLSLFGLYINQGSKTVTSATDTSASDTEASSAADTVKTIIKGVKDIRWGVDIQGGVNVTFGPEEGYDATDEQMAAVKETLEYRLVANNITDYELYVDDSDDRVMISFPWTDGAVQDVESTINELAATAELLFVKGYVPYNYLNSVYADENGKKVAVTDFEDNQYEVALDGSAIKSATVGYDSNNQLVVNIEFTDEGAELFAAATAAQVGDYLSIWMDYGLISCPMVNEAITGGQAQISQNGGFSPEDAQTLANYINSGALPFTLITKDYDVIDATLGKDSLTAMMIAGIIAFALICVFMICYYRLPGFVACIALLGQAAGMFAAVSGFFTIFKSFTLTLPGIAGIILSIGMGVDANIITSERIKEEINKGKSIDGAIEAGFSNSFSSIFDGNITNVIVAVILMGVFGPPETIWSKLLTPFLWMFPAATTGAIYSFGYTLLAGVIFNFVMGVFASRVMIKSLSRFKIFRKRALYGGVDEK